MGLRGIRKRFARSTQPGMEVIAFTRVGEIKRPGQYIGQTVLQPRFYESPSFRIDLEGKGAARHLEWLLYSAATITELLLASVAYP